LASHMRLNVCCRSSAATFTKAARVSVRRSNMRRALHLFERITHSFGSVALKLVWVLIG
jgi:hypothetical protein